LLEIHEINFREIFTIGENILSLEGAIANFQRTLRRLARVATGLGHVAGQREQIGRRYGGH